MGRRRKGDAFSEVVTGVFMLAVLSLLVYFTIVISGVDIFLGREYVRVTIAFDGVGGLKDHDNVMYRGTKVGTVDHVRLTETNLVAVVDVDKGVVLRTGYRAYVQSMSLLGGNHLVLEEGFGEPIELAHAPMLHGETPTDWMRDVAQIARNLSSATSGEELRTIVTNLAVVSEKVRLVSERLEAGEGILGRLMSKDDGGLYEDLRGTMSNARDASSDLKTTLANASVVSDRLVKGEGPLGKLLSPDETALEDLKDAIASFRRTCDSLNMGEDLKTGVTNAVAGANRLVDSLNVVADRLKSGEGTLGRLATAETLYKEVEGLVRDARQVLDNFRDTTPITTFSSLATGAL